MTIGQILNLTHEQIRDLSHQERWDLIAELEAATDQLQQTMIKLKGQKIAYNLMQHDHARIRTKILIIWSSFRPRIMKHLQFADQLPYTS